MLPNKLSELHHPLRDADVESIGASSTTTDVEAAQRVLHLERSLEFLRRQHHEILVSLQVEIEALKRQNKGMCCVMKCVLI